MGSWCAFTVMLCLSYVKSCHAQLKSAYTNCSALFISVIKCGCIPLKLWASEACYCIKIQRAPMVSFSHISLDICVLVFKYPNMFHACSCSGFRSLVSISRTGQHAIRFCNCRLVVYQRYIYLCGWWLQLEVRVSVDGLIVFRGFDRMHRSDATREETCNVLASSAIRNLRFSSELLLCDTQSIILIKPLYAEDKWRSL